MLKNLLLFTFSFSLQFAIGQTTIYGDYKGTQLLFDTIPNAIHLSLKKDGSYTMQYPRMDSLVTLTGKWRKKGDRVELKSKYSKSDRLYGFERTSVFNIEGDRLIERQAEKERKQEKRNRKFERQISKEVGEKVTLKVIKSEPLILYKES